MLRQQQWQCQLQLPDEHVGSPLALIPLNGQTE
nr:MAG TPA: hypothetical protein [Caudoviricetes sp.]